MNLTENALMLANRLNKNQKHLRKWLKRENISCFRVYDADIPEYALAVDIYQVHAPIVKTFIHVQEYEAPKKIAEEKTRQRLQEALEVIKSVFEVNEEQIFIKVRKQQKGTGQYQKLDSKQQFFLVYEAGHQFVVNFSNYLDTGLFLDHRITRGMLEDMARDRDFLNLFAYTGSGTVYAAAGGAKSTTTVDMSKTYLDWARQNMQINGFTAPEHQFFQADCTSWLKKQHKRKYGLIFLDPPSFSTSKRMQGTFDVQRDHVELIKKALLILDDNGILIFSNNLRSFRFDYDALARYQVQDISRLTLPKDYERNPRIHQCWRISHKAAG